MLTVYRQAAPIRSLERNKWGEDVEAWKANLIRVGEAESFADAKRLTLHPITEQKAE